MEVFTSVAIVGTFSLPNVALSHWFASWYHSVVMVSEIFAALRVSCALGRIWFQRKSSAISYAQGQRHQFGRAKPIRYQHRPLSSWSHGMMTPFWHSTKLLTTFLSTTTLFSCSPKSCECSSAHRGLVSTFLFVATTIAVFLFLRLRLFSGFLPGLQHF